MANQLLDLIESFDAAQASIQRLFNAQQDGTGVRGLARSRGPAYQSRLTEAVKFIGQVFEGKRPMWQLKEALSTSDFPLMFGDTIDRVMLAKYKSQPGVWRQFIKTSTVQDFRTAKRFKATRGAGILDDVGPGGSYKADAPSELSYSFAVSKRGRRRDILWEALINDDLNALQEAPDDLAYQAANTENYVASSFYVANSTLYATSGGGRPTGGNKGTGKLTIENLELAINQMALFRDENGQPILNTPRYLVVPPALELTARKILQSITLTYTGTTDQTLATKNALQGMLEPVVDHWIPILDTTNGNTSWYLFSDPADGWAVEVAFLAGHETPELFMKASNQVLLGGGAVSPMEGDFDTDSVAYKMRHVIGGAHTNAVGGWRFSYMSDGTV